MSFFVQFVDAFSLIDAVVILLCRVADHADLVVLVDEVALNYMSAGGREEQSGYDTQASRDW